MTVNEMKKVALKIGGELLLIVVAVLLALAADQWIQERTKRKHAEATLINIYYEILNNREHLVAVIQQRQSTLDQFDEKLAVFDKIDVLSASEDDLKDLGHFAPYQPWDTGWKLAESSGALMRIDYKLAHKVTAVYRLQFTYSEFAQMYWRSISFDLDYLDASRSQKAKKAIASGIYSLILYEKAMLAAYDDALQLIRETKLVK
jgi:hypothetical protein